MYFLFFGIRYIYSWCRSRIKEMFVTKSNKLSFTLHWTFVNPEEHRRQRSACFTNAVESPWEIADDGGRRFLKRFVCRSSITFHRGFIRHAGHTSERDETDLVKDSRLCFASDMCTETLLIKTNDSGRDKKNESQGVEGQRKGALAIFRTSQRHPVINPLAGNPMFSSRSPMGRCSLLQWLSFRQFQRVISLV